MLLLLLLVMVSTGLAKALLLALVRLATLSSLRMTLVRWSHGLLTRTCFLTDLSCSSNCNFSCSRPDESSPV